MERLFQARRLVHAVEVDPTKRIEVTETVWRSTGGKVGVPVEVFKGYLEPSQLKKLRAKAIFSIRDDLIKEDRKRIAEIILGEDKK